MIAPTHRLWSMKELINVYGSELTKTEIDYLHMLVGDWQVLADLAAADAVLWLPVGKGKPQDFVAISHCRPARGSTIHLDDVVGLNASPLRAQKLARVFRKGKILMPHEVRWAGSYSVIESWIPVICDGKVIAVLTLEVNVQSLVGVDEGMTWLEGISEVLCYMICEGKFPNPDTPTSTVHGTPRVGDGVIHLDQDGIVLQLTPNAKSCLRRLGLPKQVEGRNLAVEVTSILRDESDVEETLAVVVMGKASWVTEVEAGGGIVSLRAIPLYEKGERAGAILLCRDVTEMRRRERELMTKDATIREIHHRVKNNLQTVSALLRMQARRSDSPEVKEALAQAERRVAAIAKVHEELSGTIDESVKFDDMIVRLLTMSATMASAGNAVSTGFEGSFGIVDADSAAVLAVVISELVNNAVEHGFCAREKRVPDDAKVLVRAERAGKELEVYISDNGVGLGDKELGGLGTSIVRTLVRGELSGSITWTSPQEGGTLVHIHALLKNDN